MNSIDWIVFVYKIPSEPTKYRASVWREIKHLGGIYIQNGVCVFPDIDDVLLNVRSVAEMVHSYGGTEYTFVAKSVPQNQAGDLIESFHDARNEEYDVLITECDALMAEYTQIPPQQLTDVKSHYTRLRKAANIIMGRDYFDAPLGTVLATKLQALRGVITRMTGGIRL